MLARVDKFTLFRIGTQPRGKDVAYGVDEKERRRRTEDTDTRQKKKRPRLSWEGGSCRGCRVTQGHNFPFPMLSFP